MKDKRSRWSWGFVPMSAVLLGVLISMVADVSKEFSGAPWPAEARGSRPEEGPVKVKGVRTIKIDAPSYANVMAWAPDSQRLAVGGGLDKRVSVWDVQTGRKLPGPGEQNGGTQALAYSPDGLFLAVARGGVRFRGDVPVPTGPERYVVSLWDARSGAWLQNLVDETQEIGTFGVRSLAFSPDSRHFAVSLTGGLAFYEKDGSAWRRKGALAESAAQIVFSPDGGRLIGTTGKDLLLYEVPSGQVLARWPGLRKGIESGSRSVAYCSNDSQLAVGEGERLGLFNPKTGDLLKVLEPAAPFSVSGLSYSPNSRYLAVGVAAVVHLVDARNLLTVGVLSEHRHSVDRLAVSPDGAMLAAIGGSVITIWEVSGLERRASD